MTGAPRSPSGQAQAADSDCKSGFGVFCILGNLGGMCMQPAEAAEREAMAKSRSSLRRSVAALATSISPCVLRACRGGAARRHAVRPDGSRRGAGAAAGPARHQLHPDGRPAGARHRRRRQSAVRTARRLAEDGRRLCHRPRAHRPRLSPPHGSRHQGGRTRRAAGDHSVRRRLLGAATAACWSATTSTGRGSMPTRSTRGPVPSTRPPSGG